jgi:hypothetical protein
MEARRQTGQGSHLDFATILGQMERQSAAAPENIRPLSFDFLDGLIHLASAQVGDRRADFLLAADDETPQTEPQPHSLSTDPDDIARELRLSPGMSAAELAQIRRRFAARNHPDRVSAASRELASDRMKIANALIDRALAGL